MINFDNASTTKISSKALDSYITTSELFYNPSALYGQSVQVKLLIENARKFFIKYFNGPQGSTFIFTGSATESNNAVINSCVTRKDKKYIFTNGEHSSVYNTAKALQLKGYNIVFVPLNGKGQVDEDALLKEVDDTVDFVSMIHVSNETGAINDINRLTKLIKSKNSKIIVHSDGVQAVGKFPIDLSNLGVDYYTISAHKINGPKGIGALYIAKPNIFKPFVLGGGQEMNLRAGTENTPAIIAFECALRDLNVNDYSKHKHAILNNLSGDYILVSTNESVNNIISICFKGVRGETIQHMLETKGYLIGTGSACNSKAGKNRVISQLVPVNYVDGAIRLSFDSSVSIDDCVNLAKELSVVVADYRKRIN